jgi:hypothetical protein
MHAFELVELAALVAAHASPFLRLANELPPSELARYWTASKCRQDRWQLALADLKASKASLLGARGGIHCNARALFDEILTGEILARVWAGVLVAHDSCRRTDNSEPIARSVLAGHLEIRCRALSLLSSSRELPLGDRVNLDRLRRLCERWTDLLLAELAAYSGVRGLAHDSARMSDFAADVPPSAEGAYSAVRRSLLLTSLRAGYRRMATLPTPNSDLNAQIAAGIVGCFPSEMFDGSGALRSARVARLLAVADDTLIMVDDYLDANKPAGGCKLGRAGLWRF